MKSEIPAAAYFAIKTDANEWQLEEKYKRALSPYFVSSPTMLYLPWPVVLQPIVGRYCDFHGLPSPLNRLMVESVDYGYLKHRGVIAYYNTELSDSSAIELHAIRCLTEEGCLLENLAPFKVAFRRAELLKKSGMLK